MLVVSSLELSNDPVEIVERKGLGHPDTIRDALAEPLSRNLCREFRRCLGKVLHHNVGSWDLQALFSRHSASQVPLANDMSVSVGYAPLSALERLVLAMKSTSMEETVTVNTLHGVRTSRLWGFGTEAKCTIQWHVQ